MRYPDRVFVPFRFDTKPTVKRPRRPTFDRTERLAKGGDLTFQVFKFVIGHSRKRADRTGEGIRGLCP